jgi:hypothetical protein
MLWIFQLPEKSATNSGARGQHANHYTTEAALLPRYVESTLFALLNSGTRRKDETTE